MVFFDSDIKINVQKQTNELQQQPRIDCIFSILEMSAFQSVLGVNVFRNETQKEYIIYKKNVHSDKGLWTK